MKKILPKIGICLMLALFLFTGCKNQKPKATDEPASIEINTEPVTMVEIYDTDGTEIYSYMGTSKTTYRDGVKIIQIYTHMDE